MTTPEALPVRRSLGFGRRLEATVAVVIARLLTFLSPERLRALLRTLRRGARPAPYRATARAREAVTTVSLHCAGEGCLARSIATALICRAHGTWPTWRVGVRTEPFTAHAWVEADGRPVGELPGTEGFYVLMTVA
ncbi:lasso peptide biosynthesis B2 protein [Saccharothrix obliqua]|uniref:lasso peptide biosynthesis B2 protein n=1 Tax=Saccharothrix obliqua TaxID=2861747 RepID=UPI0027E24DE7|nr:lasso peptide biosynthesis B2 protein [Saccharothrix obliqua]